jgi:hypothetical protein
MLHKSIVLVVAYAALSTAMPTRLFKKLSTECPRNENWNGRECVCDRGFERTREGCVEPPATVRCGRNEIFNGRECVCDRGFEMTREGCVEPPGDDADDAEDDDAPLENMRGDSWCESKKARKSTICSKTNKRGAFRYRDEWCVKMCASRD